MNAEHVGICWWSRQTRNSNLICIHVAVKFRWFQLGKKNSSGKIEVNVLKKKEIVKIRVDWPNAGRKMIPKMFRM